MEMSSSLKCPEKLREQKIELMMEIVKGKEYANQLQTLLPKIILGNEGVSLAEELAQKVLRSFTDSLAKISSHSRTNDLGQTKEKDFDVSSKKRPAEIIKEKRGCYKRRKEAVSWVIKSPTIEDGYAWRKYGQKEIQNSNHPRCYFRCTHKFEQDCKALKQVQQLEGDGRFMYQTTYFGHHTCIDPTRAPIISDFEITDSSSMIDFRVKIPASKIPPRKNTFNPSIMKPESNGDTQSDLTDDLSFIDSNAISLAVVDSEDYVPSMGFPDDQEVASSAYDKDASNGLEGLDIKSLSDEFPDFHYYDDEL